MEAGIIGAIIGSVMGIAGGAIGTYMSITNTNGPMERAYMIRASIVVWVAVTAFLALMFLLPNPYRHLLWIPYAVLLPLGIMKLNKRLAELREADLAHSSQ